MNKSRSAFTCWPFWFFTLLVLMMASPAAWAFEADLKLNALQVDDNTPDEGQLITYTVKAENRDDITATSVIVAVPLPAGSTFVSAAPPGGTSYDDTTGAWTIGDLPKTVLTLLITARVDFGTGGSTLTTTATISSTDPAWTDRNPGDNTGKLDVTVNTVDLQITKSVNDATPDEGQTITFTVNVRNNGPAGATNVKVLDLLPAGLTFVSAAPDQGTYVSATGIWDVGTLTSGQNRDLDITATVDAGTSGTAIDNTASVDSVDQTDRDASNDQATVTANVNTADLQVTKTVNNATPDEGETVTFTIKVKNLGEAPATNVVASDILSSNLTFVSATANQGTYDEATGSWTIGTLAKGVERTLTIEATVRPGTSGTAISNTARILSVDQSDPVTTNNSASVELNVATPDLAVTKTVNDSTPDEGQAIRYTIQVENLGPAQATGIEITDLLPAGVTFQSINLIEQGTYDPATGLWDLGTLNDGQKRKLEINVTVDSGTAARVITNTARVTDLVQTDGDISNNVDSVDIFVNGADLAVTKTVDKPAPSEGDTIVYTVTLINNGPLKANNITITDVLPSGVTYVSSTRSQGDAYVPASGTWFANDLNALASATLTITATVNGGTTGSVIVNTAAVTSVVEADSITDNNSGSAVIAVGNADVAVSKTVNVARAAEGATVTYSVTVTNNGPNIAAGFSIADQLPEGVTYASHSIAPASGAGSYDPVSGTWSWGTDTLAVAASATLSINATVDSGTAAQTITNTATLTAVQAGNDPNNDSASASFQVAGADLAITKTVDNDRPEAGTAFTYTLTVTNNGPDPATGVEVTDALPPGLVFDSATASQGTYDEPAGVWTVGDLGVTSSATLDIVVTMSTARRIENIAAITASGQADSATDNNEARITISGAGNFAAGACIIDMGVDADLDGVQSVNEGLAPYGLLYNLITIHRIPVEWVISPDKVTEDGIDVTINGIDYRHAPFVIPEAYVDEVIDDPAAGDTVRDKLAAWAATYPGFTYRCDLPAFTAPVYDTLTVWPRAVLDLDNGPLAEPYYENAGFPALSGPAGDYAILGRPRDLNECNDIYVMPHADPHSNWLDGESGQLADGSNAIVYDTIKFLKFVEQGGQLWAACHAVSSMERLVDVPPQAVWDAAGATPLPETPPSQTPTGLFLLSDQGLVEWGDHDGGSGTYVLNDATAADPIMQYLGGELLALATENGSEQIYLTDDATTSSNWRSSTTVALYDPLQTDLMTNGGDLSEGGPANEAMKLGYGHAYGNPDYGVIMYEAGHSHDKGGDGDVAAQRAFFNLHFLTGVLRRPQIEGSLAAISIERNEIDGVGAELTVKGVYPGDGFTYHWTDSNCDGTFDPQGEATTIWTPPADQATLQQSRTCLIRVAVEDTCLRANFTGFPLQVLAYDVGDAPASYEAGNVARHAIWADGPYLGSGPDAEDSDSVPAWSGAGADGDDNDGSPDEDGATFDFNFLTHQVVATVTASNPNAQDAKLCGYLDGGNTDPFAIDGVFFRDGSVADEEICVTVPAGTVNQAHELAWDWNTSATLTTYARFRITTDPEFFSTNSPSPTGEALDGEIEDYPTDITPTSVTVGDVELGTQPVAGVIGSLGVEGVLGILATWSPETAEAISDADAATIAGAASSYLDPDGDGQVAVLRWETLQERGTVGFYVERGDPESGVWQRINGGLLPGLVDAPLGGEYWLADPEAQPGGTFDYRLIEQEAWGNQRTYGPWRLSLPE